MPSLPGAAVRVVQFTDCHLVEKPGGTFLGIQPQRTLDAVIESARRHPHWPPDLVLLTGDLAQDCSPVTYRRIRGQAATCKVPIAMLPGNHDDRACMAETFSTPPFVLGGSIPLGNWLIVLIDSTVPGQVGGLLEQQELERLEHCLSSHPSHYTLICLHHQPIPVGSAWIDALGIANGTRLLAIIDRYAGVRGVLWGHVHQAFDATRNGVRFMATPSTGVQFRPASREFSVDPLPPGYRRLSLYPDGRIETEVERLSTVPEGLQTDCLGY
jgi:Icc protein